MRNITSNTSQGVTNQKLSANMQQEPFHIPGDAYQMIGVLSVKLRWSRYHITTGSTPALRDFGDEVCQMKQRGVDKAHLLVPQSNGPITLWDQGKVRKGH